MEPRPKSPTWPSHCTAASTRAPAAIRARGAHRFDTVDTAMLLPMALYNARHTKAMPKCLDSKCNTLVSGVEDNRGVASDLKSASPNDLVHCIGGGSPVGCSATSGASSSSSSSSSSRPAATCGFRNSNASPFLMHTTAATSPRVVITTRCPDTKATVAQQPSGTPGCFSMNSASNSSKLSFMATSRRVSSQNPRKAESLGNSFW
mmetsp:Transcript_5553/g.9934  ORF Transcript_5553/g.9934 Transcript_5553/m.9934 type:complete len:205 (+) Transcript_5553:272-886(+)